MARDEGDYQSSGIYAELLGRSLADRYQTNDPQSAAESFLNEYYPNVPIDEYPSFEPGSPREGYAAEYDPRKNTILYDESKPYIQDPYGEPSDVSNAQTGLFAHEISHSGDKYTALHPRTLQDVVTQQHFDKPEFGNEMEKNQWWLLNMGHLPGKLSPYKKLKR